MDSSTLLATDAGFLTCPSPSKDPPRKRSEESSEQGGGEEPLTKVMCIVGLAHANGVLERCSELNLQSPYSQVVSVQEVLSLVKQRQ